MVVKDVQVWRCVFAPRLRCWSRQFGTPGAGGRAAAARCAAAGAALAAPPAQPVRRRGRGAAGFWTWRARQGGQQGGGAEPGQPGACGAQTNPCIFPKASPLCVCASAKADSNTALPDQPGALHRLSCMHDIPNSGRAAVSVQCMSHQLRVNPSQCFCRRRAARKLGELSPSTHPWKPWHRGFRDWADAGPWKLLHARDSGITGS